MEREAAAFLAALDDGQRAAATRRFDDEADRRWIEYRPEPRPGLILADLGVAARKAAHRLLATALSPPAYAQAMAVIALEEVLDRRENWINGRHSEDYKVVVFGTPGDDRWAWRFEGHHLSVTMTVVDGIVSPEGTEGGQRRIHVSCCEITDNVAFPGKEQSRRPCLVIRRHAGDNDLPVLRNVGIDFYTVRDEFLLFGCDVSPVHAARLLDRHLAALLRLGL